MIRKVTHKQIFRRINKKWKLIVVKSEKNRIFRTYQEKGKIGNSLVR